MHIILYVLFSVTLTVDYLDKALHIVPYHLDLLPEALSVVVSVFIIGQLSKTKKLNLGIKYIVMFSLLGVHMVNGILINSTPTGAIVLGLRIYLKYIPLFILPLVYEFKEEQIARLLKYILAICLLQLPMALFQKFYLATNTSGDWVRGTLATSSQLSILLISAVAMVWSYYLKGRIPIKYLIILMLVLFIPTTINETKGTLILLPIALIVPILITRGHEGEQKSLIPLVLIGAIMFGGFVTVYDSFWSARSERYGGSIIDFFVSDRIVKYLAPRTSEMVKDEEGKAVGRIDKMAAPIEVLSKDPVQLLVGVGVGNITPSPIRSLSSAEYTSYQGQIGSSISYLIWELGLIGISFSMIFLYMVYQDAKKLSESKGLEGTIALGWVAVVIIIVLSLFYKDIIKSNGLMYLFWFLSGYVISIKVPVRIKKPISLEQKKPTVLKKGPRYKTKNRNDYRRL